MTQEYKNIISDNIYNTVVDFVQSNIDCSIIVHNNNNWNKTLPERLESQSQFIMNITEQTMEDTYVEDGKIIINTVFDEIEYSKVFEPADIGGLMGSDGKTPVMVKPFQEKPTLPIPTKSLNNGEVDEKGLQKSMEMWKRNNPDLF
jgi:hypothetical protein